MFMPYTSSVSRAMMLIARYSSIFAVLQFVAITRSLLIAPCQKETISHSKHHPTEDSRIIRTTTRRIHALPVLLIKT